MEISTKIEIKDNYVIFISTKQIQFIDLKFLIYLIIPDLNLNEDIFKIDKKISQEINKYD